MQSDLNLRLLKTCDVIAMTTTGAAKFKLMLQGLDSKIMLVEEAGEILEA